MMSVRLGKYMKIGQIFESERKGDRERERERKERKRKERERRESLVGLK